VTCDINCKKYLIDYCTVCHSASHGCMGYKDLCDPTAYMPTSRFRTWLFLSDLTICANERRLIYLHRIFFAPAVTPAILQGLNVGQLGLRIWLLDRYYDALWIQELIKFIPYLKSIDGHIFCEFSLCLFTNLQLGVLQISNPSECQAAKILFLSIDKCSCLTSSKRLLQTMYV
jgi:hypothetical protein